MQLDLGDTDLLLTPSRFGKLHIDIAVPSDNGGQLIHCGLEGETLTLQTLDLIILHIHLLIVVNTLLFHLVELLLHGDLVNFDEHGELGLQLHDLGHEFCVLGLLDLLGFASDRQLLFSVLLTLSLKGKVFSIDLLLELSCALLHISLKLCSALFHISLKFSSSLFHISL